MKNTLTLSILILAGSANAQYRPIVPSFPGANNPVVSLPKNLPSPFSGTLIRLPAPAVTPSLILAGISLPAAALPAAPITARRENVANPMSSVLPTISVRFSEVAERRDAPKSSVERSSEKDELDRIFDGKLPGHRPARRINIPEREMEQELGL